ncbi:Zinc finger BED domain-containing protein 5 [Eumeta japonica]|uniref:Zinc finger BED domain-containing protein 5 n=1 Tax=Eumeta variegata TaxID=151549 RepID=A0A4C1T7Y2_EUMVA|nr:Zinc finger BED domain-containing protein 5 [Eumeta japonica]
MKTVLAANSEYLRASFLVAYKVAKTGKSYNIAEELILPAAENMVSYILGVTFSKLLDKIPLSNDTLPRRIHDMAHDVENQLALQLQNNYYAIRVDESTCISGLPNSLGFVRYVYRNICEDFLFCKTLESTTKGEDIFNIIHGYIEEHGIEWTKCVGMSTDGAKPMTGRIS